MQHKLTAFSWRASIAVAPLALCLALDPGLAADRLARGSGLVVAQGEVLRGPPAGASAPAVSQQAVLSEEDPAPPGRSFFGLVAWRTEVPPAGVADQDPAVLAQITIPGRLDASLTLRRYSDQNLAASHIIEITFDMPRDASTGGISNIPGVLMKVSRDDAGSPLAGLAEKVNNSSFLIGLSAASPQMQNNLRLLKDRDWLDILIVYNTGRRAILSVQKGPSGNRAFAEAFSAWKQ